MIRFIYWQDTYHKTHIERAHGYSTDCFEAAYCYMYKNFANAVDIWSQETLNDFLYAVQKITVDLEANIGVGSVQKHFTWMRNMLVRCAVAHAPQIFRNLDKPREIVEWDSESAAQVIQASSTRTST